MKKVLISGMVGNGLEWYDYALYGHFATLISTLFFPSVNPYTSLIATFGVFAAGFAMRPLGAVLFGYIGDLYGRKTSLAFAILLMAIPTACIGLLPTYAQIGIWAPMLLTIIRLLQGLSLGGEFSGSITFMVEHAPKGKRGLVGSAAVFSLIAGMLLGSFTATMMAKLLSPEDLQNWGWRVPFLFGIVIGLVGFYIRNQTDESPDFERAKAAGELSTTPVKEAFTAHWRPMLQAIGMYLTVTVPFYVLTVFSTTFLSKILGHSFEDAITITTVSMLILMVVGPVSAVLTDRYGRKRIMLPVAFIIFCIAIPVFWFTANGSFWIIMAAQCVFAFVVGLYISPIPAVLVELFPTRVRFTGMAISYNFCAALFGGTAPILCTWLMEKTGNPLTIAYYLMGCAACTMLALYTYRDRYAEDLH